MTDAANPAPEPFEPFGPDDPWREPIRLAYDQFPSLDGLDVAADVAGLLARLGAAPPRPGDAGHLGGASATALSRELEDALWLVPTLPNGKLAEWVVRRLASGPLSAVDRRALLTRTAVAIRDLRAAAASAELAGQDTRSGGRTLADAAGATVLEVVASQKSEANVLLTEASRELDRLDPDMGEVFLLSIFAGQTAEVVTALTGRADEVVKNLLTDADTWARAQGRYPGPAGGSNEPPPAPKPPFFGSVLLAL